MPKETTQTDVVVVGAGIGGLCAAALLAKYGKQVLLIEAHSIPGGCAHSFNSKGFTFDSGPSLWSGLSRKSNNPLRQVLDAIGEADSITWKKYDGWGMVIPEGSFYFRTGDKSSWTRTLERFGGEEAVRQWDTLQKFCEPVTRASAATPPFVLRSDAAVLFPLLTQMPNFLSAAPHARYLNGRFSDLLDDAGVTNRFVRSWADYIAFALSGLDASGTLGAACAYTFGDLYSEGAYLDYPCGGSGAVIDALVRGLTKYGGRIRLGTRVDQILMDESNKAAGVVLKNGEVIHARAVVSNADAWATSAMIPQYARPQPRRGGGGALNSELAATPSFMHLHLGIRADGLPEDIGIHYSVVLGPFDDIERERSMVIVSIPTILDPTLAPEGRHVVHAYYAANEPYEIWAGLDRRSEEYKKLKEERAQPLWRALEKIIPDIRDRVEVELVASPLTHERFLSRSFGTYGPPLFASDGSTIPYAKTQIPGLLHCGDSTFPGIGVPSAAASGINAANTLVSPWQQIALMRQVMRF